MKARHTLITGDSGGGKTTLMREIHARWPGVSIWVNHNRERVPDGRTLGKATTVRTTDDLFDAVEQGVEHINYHAGQLEGIEAARSVAYHVTHKPVQIVVDEIQNVWPDKGERNQVSHALHEDRDEGLRLLFATQDPQDLKPYTPLKQAQWIAWCGEWTTFHEGFLRYYGISQDTLPSSPHEYAVLDKQADVVERGKTDSEYA